MGCIRVLGIVAPAAIPLRAFEITSTVPEPGEIAIQEGQYLDLWCNANDWWEWCTFTHVPTGKICDLQWRYGPDNVTANDCDNFEYLGNYNYYKCGVRIYNADLAMAGLWRCDLTEWTRAATGRASKVTDSRTFSVEVEATTTTTTTTALPPLPSDQLTDNGFSLISYEPSSGSAETQVGWPLELWCNVDDWWEWCSFTNLISNKSCEFQWRYGPDNVTVNRCDFEGRYEFLGDYNNYKCGIRIYNIGTADAGPWTCDLEEWNRAVTVRGSGYGAEVRKAFRVFVTEWVPESLSDD